MKAVFLLGLLMKIMLGCSAGNCNKGTCPDCGECVIFCNCTR